MKIPNSHPKYSSLSKQLQIMGVLITVLVLLASFLKANAHVDCIDFHTPEMEILEKECHRSECEKAFERERAGEGQPGDTAKACEHLENHTY